MPQPSPTHRANFATRPSCFKDSSPLCSENSVVSQPAKHPASQKFGVTESKSRRLVKPIMSAAIHTHSQRSITAHQIQPYHPHSASEYMKLSLRRQLSQAAPAPQATK